MNKPSNIIIQHEQVNVFTRTGIIRKETAAIDIHYNGNPGMTEFELAKYIHELSKQDPHDKKPDDYVSANYIVGPQAIIELVPPQEVTYTAGANNKDQFYTHLAKNVFGESYTRYWPDSYIPYTDANGRVFQFHHSPNLKTCSIECIHPDKSGKFERKTIINLISLVIWLATLFNVPTSRVLRHYDITGKLCPLYWVLHSEDWCNFRRQISTALSIEEHNV